MKFLWHEQHCSDHCMWIEMLTNKALAIIEAWYHIFQNEQMTFVDNNKQT